MKLVEVGRVGNVTDEEATLLVTLHPSFAVHVREYVEMARSGALFDGMDESLEDIEELRTQILTRWSGWDT